MFDFLMFMIAIGDDHRGFVAMEFPLIALLTCVIVVALFPALKRQTKHSTFGTIGTHLMTGK